jgi:phytoene dehydrogenase-like protein
MLDAVVVGSGPNGLAAAIELARAGRSVLVLERAGTAGGGMRTAELTLPGFRHDVCSAIHPLGAASPFFRQLPLAGHGLAWVEPPAAVAHPLDDGTAVVLDRSVTATAARLGGDGDAYGRLFDGLVERAEAILEASLSPLRIPRSPISTARFGATALQPAARLARRRFHDEPARALFAGLAAHSMLPLERAPSGGVALVLGLLGHTTGWPFPRGGAQALADALASHLSSLGGEIRCGERVDSIHDLPDTRTVLLDVSPRETVRIAGSILPRRYRERLQRFRYGPGAFKLDLALDGPIPWAARECEQAATVHVGGSHEGIAACEAAVGRGETPEQPFVIVAQQSLFDSSRAPARRHTAWAYCHVPNGSDADMTDRIEAQIERFAPGFRARILARHALGPRELEELNPNYVGGDINGGTQDLRQLFTRPAPRPDPYSTPAPGLFLCSASTPPGGGVHGMCGYWAARAALRGPLRASR